MYKSTPYSNYEQGYWHGDGYSQESYQNTLPSSASTDSASYSASTYDQVYTDATDNTQYASSARWDYGDSQAADQYQYQQYAYQQDTTGSYDYQVPQERSVDPYAYQEKSAISENYEHQGKQTNLSQQYGSFQGKYTGSSYGYRGGKSNTGGSMWKRKRDTNNTTGSTESVGYQGQSNYKKSNFYNKTGNIFGNNSKISSTFGNNALVNGQETSNFTMTTENKTDYTSPLMSMEAKRGYKAPEAKQEEDNRRPLPIDLDPNLPEEIVKLLKNSSCDLCNVKMNSRIQAKTHYEGKKHAMKIKSALEAKNTGESITVPEIANKDSTDPPPAKKKKGVTDGSKLYCKCCDLSFTSTDHATQHYLGRNHQRVLHGLKPLKAGYFNKETGKWQRAPPDPRTTTEVLEETTDPDSVKDKGKFFCELCGVSATSQDQLAGHLNGQRHKKTQASLAKKQNQAAATIGSQDTILDSIIQGDDGKKATKTEDFSIYRTPSGKFYCSPCDMTVNSEHQFAQHVESKKHKLKKK